MKQILCFGDSNTYGLIPGTTNQRYGWGTRWTSILDDKVRTKGYRVIEEGLCGRTTVFDDPFRTERRGTEMLPAILESHRPVDTIVLMLGTNDCKSVYSATPEVIGQGIEQLLDQAAAAARQAENGGVSQYSRHVFVGAGASARCLTISDGSCPLARAAWHAAAPTE